MIAGFSIAKERSQIRSTPGLNYLAIALKKVEDAINQQGQAINTLSVPAPVVAAAPALASTGTAVKTVPQTITVINSASLPVAQGTNILVLSTSSIVASNPTGAIALTYATWVEIASATISPSGNTVELIAFGQLNNQADNWVAVLLQFYKGSTPIGNQQNVSCYYDNNFAAFCLSGADSSPGTTPVTYSIYAYLNLDVTMPVYAQVGQILAINSKT